jgi:hypothetical protein
MHLFKNKNFKHLLLIRVDLYRRGTSFVYSLIVFINNLKNRQHEYRNDQ